MAASAQVILSGVASTLDLQLLRNDLEKAQTEIARNRRFINDLRDVIEKMGNSAPPAPPPAVNPTPAPSNVMSAAQKARMIAAMGRNTNTVLGWEKNGQYHQSGAQFKGGAVVMGARAMIEQGAPGWWWGGLKNQGNLGKYLGRFMELIEPWGVFLELKENTDKRGELRADVRNIQCWILRQGKSTWERIDVSGVAWEATFQSNMSTNTGRAQRLIRGDGYDTTVVDANAGTVSHWGAKQMPWVSNPETVEGIAITMEARVNPANPNAKLGLQVGADYKRWNDGGEWAWYPGAGLSRIQPLTKQWERYYFVNLDTSLDANHFPKPGRTISQDRLQKSVFPLAD